MDNLNQLFVVTIKDLFSAERQFNNALPKLMKEAQDEQLKAALKAHISQTDNHITGIKRVSESGGFKPVGKTSIAADGLVEETWNLLEDCVPGPTMDAAIIACVQKHDHYEMAAYGTALAWADALGNKTAAKILNKTLDEEAENKQTLAEIAEDVNRAAAETVSEVGDEPEPKS